MSRPLRAAGSDARGRAARRALIAVLVALAIGCGGGEVEPDGGRVIDGGSSGEDASMGDAGDDAGGEEDAGIASRVARVYVGRTDGELVAHSIGADGSLAETSHTRTGSFPSFAAISPDARSMYVVNEAADSVVSLAIEAGTGRTTVRNEQPAGGRGPTHVSIDHEGRFVLVASFGGGTVRVFPVETDGRLGAATDTESPGATAHAIEVDRSNRWALVPCRDEDRVVIYALDGAGQLTLGPSHRTARGAGPRHLAFDADGDRVYLVNELDSTVDVLAFDAAAGTLAHLQTISTLPAEFSGANSGAEILVHDRFVYASNRGHDSIAIFEIGAEGRLSARGHALLDARTPRSMSITPDGSRLYAGALDGGVVVRFAIGSDGSLTREGATTVAGDPFFVGAFAIPD